MDTHKHTLTNGKVSAGLILDGSGYSETIKGSNLSESGAAVFDIVAGDEDGIDVVRGEDYLFEDGRIDAGKSTRCFITAKGGIDGLIIRDVTLFGKTRWWRDIGLGDHTIYNKGNLMDMKNVLIDNVRRSDGKPVKILVLDCDKPICTNGKYCVVKIPKLLVKLFLKIKG